MEEKPPPNTQGSVSLVLGAGNQPSIGFLDALHFLMVENSVVIYKHNPVASWNTAFYDDVRSPFLPFLSYNQAFGPLVKQGFVVTVEGGAAEGAYLVDKCDSVHMTGSAQVHDMIVWGMLLYISPALLFCLFILKESKTRMIRTPIPTSTSQSPPNWDASPLRSSSLVTILIRSSMGSLLTSLGTDLM